MQTFLPYESYTRSAQVLDRQRLGKQRVEVLQLLKALSGESKGWANHPAANMWRGKEFWLGGYGLTICDEWIGRGYHDSCREKIIERSKKFSYSACRPRPVFGAAFHRAHQSNLIRKDPAYYGPLFPGVPDDLPYIWEREA